MAAAYSAAKILVHDKRAAETLKGSGVGAEEEDAVVKSFLARHFVSTPVTGRGRRPIE